MMLYPFGLDDVPLPGSLKHPVWTLASHGNPAFSGSLVSLRNICLPLLSLVWLKSPDNSAAVGTRESRAVCGTSCSCHSCEKNQKNFSLKRSVPSGPKSLFGSQTGPPILKPC